MPRLVFILVVVLLYACADKTDINGHWHAVDMEVGTNQTLDIDDTLAISNKWSLQRIWSIECLRWHPDSVGTGKQHLPSNEWSHTTKIHFENDTLTVGDGTQSFRYVQYDLKQCEIEDRYRNLSVHVAPPATPVLGYSNYHPGFADVFIGKALEEYSIRPDSMYIEVVNVFIGFKDVKRYCEEVKLRAENNVKPSILLHADKQVSERFLQSVMIHIPSEFSVYQAVVDPNNSLAVIKLR